MAFDMFCIKKSETDDSVVGNLRATKGSVIDALMGLY